MCGHFLTLWLPPKLPKPQVWFVLHHLLKFVGTCVLVCRLLTSPWWVLVCWWRIWSCSAPPGASYPRCWPRRWLRWCHPGPNCRPLPCCLELSMEGATEQVTLHSDHWHRFLRKHTTEKHMRLHKHVHTLQTGGIFMIILQGGFEKERKKKPKM